MSAEPDLCSRILSLIGKEHGKNRSKLKNMEMKLCNNTDLVVVV